MKPGAERYSSTSEMVMIALFLFMVPQKNFVSNLIAHQLPVERLGRGASPFERCRIHREDIDGSTSGSISNSHRARANPGVALRLPRKTLFAPGRPLVQAGPRNRLRTDPRRFIDDPGPWSFLHLMPESTRLQPVTFHR